MDGLLYFLLSVIFFQNADDTTSPSSLEMQIPQNKKMSILLQVSTKFRSGGTIKF